LTEPPVLETHPAALPAEAVKQAFSVGDGGLSGGEATRRLAAHGPNRVSAARRRSALAVFLAQFNDILIYALLVAAVVTTALGQPVDTAVILGVVLINALIGFFQERRAEQSLAAIRGLIASRATVIRDGRRSSIPVEDVVPGDLVVIEPGDRVPADLRLIRCRGLEMQEAILTGESVPVGKDTDAVALGTPLAERTSMAFGGTTVARGQGTGFAVATGDATELGRISALLRAVEAPATPLTRQLGALGRTVTLAIGALSAVTFAWGYLVNGMSAGDLFLIAVGIAVAAIPEGLPAIVTITLAIGVERMARRNAIVRHLPAVETLGSVGVVCSDKTGTFTRNEMVVETAVTGAGSWRVTGIGYRPEGELVPERQGASPVDLRRLATAAAYCNDAALVREGNEWTVAGDPMEGALLAFAARTGVDIAEHDRRRSDEVPFDPDLRFMATLHACEDGNPVAYVKGAPERVIAMCDSILSPVGPAEIDRPAWEERAAGIARQGMRVLALAEKRIDHGGRDFLTGDVDGGLTLIGLVGLMDPPRPEAVEAVARCRSAGIEVKMITGDHVETATAIATQLGLARPANALTGIDIDRLDDRALVAAVAATDVFARTSPEHKLRLVETLQANGSIVAMTGDGVNDAPALKRADVGVAMGRRGADATRDAASIVLADDNFATIAAAVEHGRQVYDNLRKAIVFILPTNAAEALVLVIAVLFGLVSPITPVQILWVNLITEVTLSLALAFEAAEGDLMRRPPRSSSAPILSRFVVWRIVLIAAIVVAGVFGVFYWSLDGGADVAIARTAAVNTIVAFEAVYLFSARRLRDPGWTGLLAREARPLWIAVGLVLVAQAAFTYLPVMNALFGTVPLPPGTWLVIGPVALTVFVVAEFDKTIVRRRRSRRT
jgi:magnesium-transporting ATPase (P-type)